MRFVWIVVTETPVHKAPKDLDECGGDRMTVPVFEEYEPALDCPCAGCAERRRIPARELPVRAGCHRAVRGARRALVLATAAGVALGATGVSAAGADGPSAGRARAEKAADPEPPTPQGGSAPLHGPGGVVPGPSSDELPQSTRADIINRAKQWVSAKVPYSMTAFWSDGYRQDCSGYVSMAWNLGSNEWTGSLAQYGTKITREELQPGDMLLFHNPADPSKGSHVTLFGGWTDFTHSYYIAYEQTQPHTRAQATPMAYWTDSARYVPYRYKGLTAAADSEAGPSDTYPGAASFGFGAGNTYVAQLGRMLMERGGERFYRVGPGILWGESDRRATQAFQLAQGWRGPDADGFPGRETWRYLVNGLGKNIAASAADSSGSPVGGGVGTDRAPVFPGAGYFRPGQTNKYVEQLARQLVKKGFGKNYGSEPGPRWGESDRRNVEAFQRAQGWRGSAADGYPGRETWQRLFA
jgi:hypothetical protein